MCVDFYFLNALAETIRLYDATNLIMALCPRQLLEMLSEREGQPSVFLNFYPNNFNLSLE